ncbi:MAG: hypothetical protein R8M45_00655 [Ghiorsea sp.]
MLQSNNAYTLVLGISGSETFHALCSLAAKGTPLIIVASRKESLQALCLKLPQNTAIKLFVCDIYDVQSRLQLLEGIASLQIHINRFINNAGDGHVWSNIKEYPH